MSRTGWTVGLLLVAAAVVVWDGVRIMVRYRTTPGGPEVGGYEALLGILLVVLAVVHWWGQRRAGARTGAAPPADGGSDRPVWQGLALLGAYVASLDILGFFIATAAFLIVFLRLFGSYAWTAVVAGSLAMAGATAYGLALLDLPLPRGMLL